MSTAPNFRLTRLVAKPGWLLVVAYADGLALVVAMKCAIGRHPILRSVLKSTVFPRVKIDDMGRTAAWPGREDHEIGSDQVRAWALSQARRNQRLRYSKRMRSTSEASISARRLS